MPIFSPDGLLEFGTHLLRAAGAPADVARLVSESLVGADMCGHASHGLMRIPRYVAEIREGLLNPTAKPRTREVGGAVAVVDGAWGFGQVSARAAARKAAELAHAFGVGAVSLRQTNHVGRLADYVEVLAAQGLASIVMTGGGRPGGAVSPHGGSQRMFGTNPIAYGVPRSGYESLVVDFATAQAAEGKVALALAKGEAVPAGWLIDSEGKPTTDPADFYAGGALLPFGGYKGYALQLMIDILSNGLSGMPSPSSPKAMRASNPTLFIALNISSFVDSEEFATEVDALLERVRTSRPAAGVEAVLVPGERAARQREYHRRNGVYLSTETSNELLRLAHELELPADLVEFAKVRHCLGREGETVDGASGEDR